MDPLSLMTEYLAATPGADDDPMFVYGADAGLAFQGTPVTGDHITFWIKRCVVRFGHNPDHYASHSLRIGCATALADAGKDDSFIRQHGRWKSDTFIIYMRRSADDFATAAAAIAATDVRPLRA